MLFILRGRFMRILLLFRVSFLRVPQSWNVTVIFSNLLLQSCSGVSLSPHHADARFIATASTDRTVKLWDRQDLALPVSWSKRSRITDIRWRRHWPGVLVSVEDVYS